MKLKFSKKYRWIGIGTIVGLTALTFSACAPMLSSCSSNEGPNGDDVIENPDNNGVANEQKIKINSSIIYNALNNTMTETDWNSPSIIENQVTACLADAIVGDNEVTIENGSIKSEIPSAGKNNGKISFKINIPKNYQVWFVKTNQNVTYNDKDKTITVKNLAFKEVEQITQQDVDIFVNQTANNFINFNNWTLSGQNGLAIFNKNDTNWNAAKSQGYKSVIATLTNYFSEQWKTDVNVSVNQTNSDALVFSINVDLVQSKTNTLKILYNKDWNSLIDSFPQDVQNKIDSINVKIDLATKISPTDNTVASLQLKLNEVVVSTKNTNSNKFIGKPSNSNINNIITYMVCDSSASPTNGSQFITQMKNVIQLNKTTLTEIDNLLKPWLLGEYNTEGQEIKSLSSYTNKFNELKTIFQNVGLDLSEIKRTTFDMLTNTNGIDGFGYGYEKDNHGAQKTVSIQFIFSGNPIISLDNNSNYQLGKNNVLLSPHFKTNLGCSQYDFRDDQLTNLKNVLTTFATKNIQYRINNDELNHLVTKDNLLTKMNNVFKETDSWLKIDGISIWGGGRYADGSFNENGQIQFQIAGSTIWDTTNNATDLTYDFATSPSSGFKSTRYNNRNYLTPWINTGMLKTTNISASDAQNIYNIMSEFCQSIDKRYPTTEYLMNLPNYNPTIEKLNNTFAPYDLKVSDINLYGSTAAGYVIDNNQTMLNWSLDFENDPVKLTIDNNTNKDMTIDYYLGKMQFKGSNLTSIPTITLNQNQLSTINDVLITYSQKMTSFSPNGALMKITAANFSNADDYNNFINDLSSVLGPNIKVSKILAEGLINTGDNKLCVTAYRIFFGGPNITISGDDNLINFYNYSDECGTALITNRAKVSTYSTNANNLENGNGVLVVDQTLSDTVANILKTNAQNVDLTHTNSEELILSSKELSNIEQLKNEIATATNNYLNANDIIFKAANIHTNNSSITFDFQISFKNIKYIIPGANRKSNGIGIMNFPNNNPHQPYMHYEIHNA